MQILFARTSDEVHSAGVLFQEYVEPLLLKLEAASKRGHAIGRTQLGQDYLQVCRWPFRQLEYSCVLAAIRHHGKSAGKALDAGSGITPFGHVLAAMGFDVRACDFDPRLMEDLAGAGMEAIYGSSVTYEWQDLTSLRYPDETFDLITSVSVLEHISAPADQTALRELIRVLKPGGQLLVTVDYEPASAAPRLGGRYRTRVGELLSRGEIGEIARSAMRKLRGRRVVGGGAARHLRTANQSFTLAYLLDDMGPIMGTARRDVAFPYAVPPEGLHSEDVPAFWNLVPGLFDVQGGRIVLPAVFQYFKPST